MTQQNEKIRYKEHQITSFIIDERQKNATYEEKRKAIQTHTGKLPYPLTNDYIFHVVFQENQTALKGLISCILDLPLSDIRSLEIINPIEKGKMLEGKEFILDIKVVMNDKERLNIEMQINNYNDWQDRSLSYNCRMFDHLEEGQPYTEVKPCIQIGILDFPLFKEKEKQKFHYKFLLKDDKDSYIYTGKFVIHVLCLKQVNKPDPMRTKLQEETKREQELRQWARLFKAKTWKEVKKLAEISKEMMETVYTYHCVTADEMVRLEAEARERNEREKATVLRWKQQAEQLEQDKQQLEQDKQKAEAKQQVAEEQLQTVIRMLEQGVKPEDIPSLMKNKEAATTAE